MNSSWKELWVPVIKLGDLERKALVLEGGGGSVLYTPK